MFSAENRLLTQVQLVSPRPDRHLVHTHNDAVGGIWGVTEENESSPIVM
jgi:hypothetical protein